MCTPRRTAPSATSSRAAANKGDIPNYQEKGTGHLNQACPLFLVIRNVPFSPFTEVVAQAVAPDYALGAHVAALGLVYAQQPALPARFSNGMFIGEHGSWNRDPPAGYKVVFVPFANGKPAGAPLDVLTGFVNDQGEARGRPVGVALDTRGALLVADDVGNVVWRAVTE